MKIKCANCNKELMEIDEKTINHNEAIFKCVATCCYCGDNSFVFDFYKNSRASGVGIETEVEFDIVKDCDKTQKHSCPDFIAKTKINNFVKGGDDKWVFQIGKA